MRKSMTTGARVFKFCRRRKGWSLREMARQMEINHANLSRIENGRRMPSQQQELLLSRLMQKPYAILIEECLKDDLLEREALLKEEHLERIPLISPQDLLDESIKIQKKELDLEVMELEREIKKKEVKLRSINKKKEKGMKILKEAYENLGNVKGIYEAIKSSSKSSKGLLIIEKKYKEAVLLYKAELDSNLPDWIKEGAKLKMNIDMLKIRLERLRLWLG